MNKYIPLAKQMIGYFVVAAIGLVLDFAAVIISKEWLGIHYLLAVCVGFIIGLVATYILSSMFVFGEPEGSKSKTFLLFGIIGLGGLGILNLLVWALTDGLGLNYLISKGLATGVVFIWNFLARRSLYTGSA